MATPRQNLDEDGKKIMREADVSDHRTAQRHLLVPVGALNSTTPCAACKLLRRRCAQECPFSLYFPAHEPQKFASVHKVFGASNVSKLLMEVPENQRGDAANSLVYEANVRLRDPVYGCMGAISQLQQQVHVLEAELAAVRTAILKHKYRQSNTSIIPTCHSSPLTVSSKVSVPTAVTLPSIATQLPAPGTSFSKSMYTASTSADYRSFSNDHVTYYG